MKSVTLSVTLMLSVFCAHAQSHTMAITSPTNNQVLYYGEEVDIQWRSVNSNNFISIRLQNERNGVMGWLAFITTNNGHFTWMVGPPNLGFVSTNYLLTVCDGGDYNINCETIRILIPGPRPKPVPIVIRRVVSVEWTADTNHIYRLESSPDLKSWVTEEEGPVFYQNAHVL